MLAIACLQEEAPSGVSDLISGEGERTEITVSFSEPTLSLVKVRNSILEGAETVHSGATVYAFLHDGYNMVLDDIITVEGASVQGPGHDATTQNAVLHLRSGKTYDICVVGNLWYINKSTGKKASWINTVDSNSPEATAPEFYYAAVEASYSFNGSDAGNGYRHETLAEVKTYGIPYSGQKTGVTAVKNGTVNLDNCRFLFAKVNLTVDHTGLDGELDGSESYFKNSKVSIRQANGSIVPLNVPNMLYDADNAIDADGDPSMTNAHKKTYTFYVPENLQGDLLTTDDPNLKNLENGELEPVKGLLTYLEFKGTVNPSNAYAAQIGYTGDFTYRFCLGNDNCKNFDVVGGRCYDITLNFTVNSLFNPEAEWKVSSDSFLDGRVVDVMKFADCAEALGASQPVIVRANRPGKVFLYVNKEGVATGGTNVAKGRNLVTSVASYTPSDVTDCAVCISPALSSLSEYGITAAYTASDASLSFSVTNMSKFASWLSSGQEVKLTATLLPSKDNAKKREFVLKPFADLGVSGNFDEFYVAMKRTVTCSGFYGSNFKLYNGSDKAGSPNLKYVSEDGVTRVPLGNAEHPFEIDGNGAFSVVACRETDASNQCLLCVSSDDLFNDGADGSDMKSVAVSVKRPWPIVGTIDPDNNLYVRGDHVHVPFRYYKTVTHAVSDLIPAESFDPREYGELLAPRFAFLGTHTSDAHSSIFESSLRAQLSSENSWDKANGKGNAGTMSLFVHSLPEGYRTRESYPGRAEYDIPYFTDIIEYESGDFTGVGNVSLNIAAFDVGSTDSSIGREGRTIRFQDETLTGEASKTTQTFDQQISGATFNLRSLGDMEFEILPQMSDSRPNTAITAKLTKIGTENYTKVIGIKYIVNKGTGTHSVGYHNVRMFVTNINSGEKVYSDHTFIAKVSQLNTLGGTLTFGYSSIDGAIPYVTWQVGVGFVNKDQLTQGTMASNIYAMSECGWQNVPHFKPNQSYVLNAVATINSFGGENTLRVDAFQVDSLEHTSMEWSEYNLKRKEFIMSKVKPRCSMADIDVHGNPQPYYGEKNVVVGELKDTLPDGKKQGYINVTYIDEWTDVLSKRKSNDEE